MLELNKWGDFLGTRWLGGKVRTEIEELLELNDKVMIDCEGVDMLTNSFADEAVGKLAANLGKDDFQQQIRLLNVSPNVSPILRRAIAKRLRGRKLASAGCSSVNQHRRLSR